MSIINRLRPLVAITLIAAAAPGVAHAADAVTYFPRSDDMPFSEAVRVENRLVLTGILGIGDDNQTIVPGGFEAETRRAMVNLGATLQKHGLTYDDITMCTVMMVDLKNYDAFNAIYSSHFKKGRYPARATFGVTALPRGGLIELACQARFKA